MSLIHVLESCTWYNFSMIKYVLYLQQICAFQRTLFSSTNNIEKKITQKIYITTEKNLHKKEKKYKKKILIGILLKGLWTSIALTLFHIYVLFTIDILDVLTEWTLEGLTLEKAIGQPDAAYKVRHLKMGIRVAGSLCSCDEAVATNVLVCKLS